MVRRREDEGRLVAGSASPTAQTVEQRASEIALIEHPESPTVRNEDRTRARQELTGRTIAAATEENQVESVGSRNPAEPADKTAYAKREAQAEDPQKELEDAVLEGAREAEHQRMLEAHRQSAVEQSLEEAPEEGRQSSKHQRD